MILSTFVILSITTTPLLFIWCSSSSSGTTYVSGLLFYCSNYLQTDLRQWQIQTLRYLFPFNFQSTVRLCGLPFRVPFVSPWFSLYSFTTILFPSLWSLLSFLSFLDFLFSFLCVFHVTSFTPFQSFSYSLFSPLSSSPLWFPFVSPFFLHLFHSVAFSQFYFSFLSNFYSVFLLLSNALSWWPSQWSVRIEKVRDVSMDVSPPHYKPDLLLRKACELVKLGPPCHYCWVVVFIFQVHF